MVQTVRSHVDLIVERLCEQIDIEEVIIFGSYAYGEPTVDSDIDICVVVSSHIMSKRLLLKKIRKLISEFMKYPLDILLYDREEFYNRANVKTTLEYKISKEGVKIYG